MFTYLDLLLAMGFAWMISGIILLVLNRGKISVPAWPGSSLMLVLGLTLIDNFVKPGMLPEAGTKCLYVVSRNSYFLIGPLLLYYTRALLPRGSFRKPELLHLVPFILSAVYSIINPQTLIPSTQAPLPPEASTVILRDIFSILHRIGYCYSVFLIIRRHAKTVADFYSYRTIRNTLSWLYYLVIVYLVLFVTNFIFILLPPEQHGIHGMSAAAVRIAPSMLFIFLFSIFAQNQKIPENRKSEEKQVKYSQTADESRQLYNRLNSLITAEKPFLDPDLTLNGLAAMAGETRHRLSEAINRESGENFYTYINGFRLKEFLSSVKQQKYPQYTILAIAFECGFKSQSAFYELFKKTTGMTPKEYMKKNLY